ncbi:MAG: Gfo/Idh/MocA family oxidoreductase [Kordiimonadaceae bacterium]|nr:Gfo/Idh/MocA family oxidoreductase [Kordiimonadaceae bacterium]MBO6568423.1 Gfo/Idh/MocA family oxidoreductase [Kordiimonadaceae bacterium]MBO6963848.1 Gfo/Idh/MocA family oxidoreductase [Kordiimonadaceae bacterium]
MRVIVLGLGVQGHKRRDVAGADCIGVVDPYNELAGFRHVADVPLGTYDAALVCAPDSAKVEVLTYLLSNGKHVLVEKPLVGESTAALTSLADIARQKGLCCYTAYNHRFEPHFMRMKETIDQGTLGQVYSVRLFYGNGTARLVRDSAWRDTGAGVLPDLGSHLLDTLAFWFGRPSDAFHIISANRFENLAPDHVVFGANGAIRMEAEMTLLSWRNHFTADVLAEKGSAHISSLCKWGPTSFTVRDRKLPSGRPEEQTVTLVEPDPTWRAEYDHFKTLCETGGTNIGGDIWILETLAKLAAEIPAGPAE